MARGVAHATIAARYGIPEAAIAKHASVCLGPPTPESLLENAVALQRANMRVLTHALQSDDHKLAMQAADRVERSITQIAKMIGAFQDVAAIDARSITINATLEDLSIEELRALASAELPAA